MKLKNATLQGWIICTIAAIFYCYEYVLRMEPSVMLPELMHTLNANATNIGMLSAFFYFIYMPMQIVVGLLLDIYGPRKILTLAIITCTIGSFFFGTAPTLLVASVGRLLIGFGSAFAFVSVLKLTASWLPHRFFALFVGLTTTLGMFGGMTGDIVLTPLVHSIGWKQTVHIGTIAGIILIPLIWLIIRDKPETKDDSTNIKTKVHYNEIFAGFLKILKNPQMWLIGTIGCLMYLSLSLFAELWGVRFLTTTYNLSPTSAATSCSFVFLGWLIGGPLIGYISDITNSRRIPIAIGCILSAFFISLIIYFPQLGKHTGLLPLLLFLFGVFSSFEILCFAISSENNPKHLVATASAFTNALIMFGGIVFQPLVGKILDMLWEGQTLNGDRVYSSFDNQLALTILPFAFLFGFILTFWLHKTPNKK